MGVILFFIVVSISRQMYFLDCFRGTMQLITTKLNLALQLLPCLDSLLLQWSAKPLLASHTDFSVGRLEPLAANTQCRVSLFNCLIGPVIFLSAVLRRMAAERGRCASLCVSLHVMPQYTSDKRAARLLQETLRRRAPAYQFMWPSLSAVTSHRTSISKRSIGSDASSSLCLGRANNVFSAL